MDIELKITSSVYQTDSRIPQQSDKQIKKRTWAIMLIFLYKKIEIVICFFYVIS